MRWLLIVGWLVASSFFVWEFVNARNMPRRLAAAQPWSFRLVDSIFLVLTVTTIIYLFQHP